MKRIVELMQRSDGLIEGRFHELFVSFSDTNVALISLVREVRNQSQDSSTNNATKNSNNDCGVTPSVTGTRRIFFNIALLRLTEILKLHDLNTVQLCEGILIGGEQVRANVLLALGRTEIKSAPPQFKLLKGSSILLGVYFFVTQRKSVGELVETFGKLSLVIKRKGSSFTHIFDYHVRMQLQIQSIVVLRESNDEQILNRVASLLFRPKVLLENITKIIGHDGVVPLLTKQVNGFVRQLRPPVHSRKRNLTHWQLRKPSEHIPHCFRG
mmetsp:Transcript_12915/g.28307  ORF Transcript_12915/g.28307 Transcript_12915/m.28307 type:complete len:269 (-) Transcript_12915:679-1485(-)